MSDLAVRTLLLALTGALEGQEITADDVREAFDVAQCNTAERGAAFKAAARLGYLTGTDRVVRSTTESRKHGASRIWVRTGVALPEHVCGVSEVAS